MAVIGLFWHDVTDASDGLNEVIAQLAPQMINVHLNCVAANFGTPAVKVFFQLLTG
jgi:hypothetical protein